jgi:3-deoxy-7-phosphoheptulonate synthase
VAADTVLARGNGQLILCERGIRTFETATPTLDISAIPLVKRLSHLPVIANPSAGAGRWELVEALALGALAAGADGLVLEVHADAGELPADSASIPVGSFGQLMAKLRRLAEALGRPLPESRAETAASG